MVDPDRQWFPIGSAVGWLAALLLGAALLNWIALGQSRDQLDAWAAARLTALSNGGTIAVWPLNKPRDVIAGQVFGDAGSHFGSDGLSITSHGEAVEFGLRLDAPIDLTRVTDFRIAVSGDKRFRFQLSIPASDRPPCRTASQAAVADELHVRMDAAIWDCGDGQPQAMPHARALRLVISGPEEAQIRLADLALLAFPHPMPVMAHIPVLTSSEQIPAIAAELRRQPASTIPIVIVPPSAWQAHDLVTRKALSQAAPEAIAITDMAAITTTSARSNAVPMPWIPLAVIVVLLGIASHVHRDSRARNLAELGVLLTVPLWLGVGGRLGPPFRVADHIVIGVWIAASALLLWRGRAFRWRWLGSSRSWLLPILAIVIASIAAWLAPPSSELGIPGIAALVTYLGWATLQQLLMLPGIANRLHRIGLPDIGIVVVTALTFALLHAPNQSLMAFTLLGGLIWTTGWQRERALVPILVSHAICALILTGSLPSQWLWSAEIGRRLTLG